MENKIRYLENRMNNSIKVFNDLDAKSYPWSAMMLDFGVVYIFNQQEMAGRIRELSEILGKRYEIKTKVKDNKTVPFIEVN